MITLGSLKNTSRGRKKIKRVGRGPGSGLGKTCGRGEKGAHARAGSKRRWGYEGGQMRMHMKMPSRGFSNVRFAKRLDAINLVQIDAFFEDGETVNIETLAQRGLVHSKSYGIKILAEGNLKKKVTLDVELVSAGAKLKLQEAKISFTEKRTRKVK